MRKILAILLLIVLLFNVGGYYIVFWGLRYQAAKELSYRLETSEYQEEETTLLKIPMALPYPVQDGFQFIKGDFEHNGNYYRLVKQKFEYDTLYVVCIANAQEKQLVKKMIDFGNLSNDQHQSKHSHVSVSRLLSEYEPLHLLIITEQKRWVQTLTFYIPDFNLVQLTLSVQSPPPKFVS